MSTWFLKIFKFALDLCSSTFRESLVIAEANCSQYKLYKTGSDPDQVKSNKYQLE